MTHQLLDKSIEEYELLVFSQWLKWCEGKTVTRIQCQKLLHSHSLFNWWQKQYVKHELEFLNQIAPYKNQVSFSDAVKLLITNLDKIHNYYSKPLIQKALKNDQTAEN